MKNQREFLNLLLLLPFLCLLNANVYSQAKDPAQDLSISFSSKHEGQDPGYVFGSVKNTSDNNYPCVRLEFDLFTRYDLQVPGENSKYLGNLVVNVWDAQPGTVKAYEQRLPYAAGIGLKSITECAPKTLPGDPQITSFKAAPLSINPGQTVTLEWQTVRTDKVIIGEANPNWQKAGQDPFLSAQAAEPSGTLQITPTRTVTYRLQATTGAGSVFKDVTIVVSPGTCTITGQVAGKLRWEAKDDRGQPITFEVKEIALKEPGADVPKLVRLQGTTYTFTNVRAGKTYKIYVYHRYGKYRTNPVELTVPCQANVTYREHIKLVILGPPPVD